MSVDFRFILYRGPNLRFLAGSKASGPNKEILADVSGFGLPVAVVNIVKRYRRCLHSKADKSVFSS